MITPREYFQYLKTRSFKSYLYRILFLYPKISRQLIGNVLDIGCGIGDFLIYYKKGFGVDINKDCVEFCQSKNLNVTHFENNIPFKDSYFDSAILDNVLEHISEPFRLLVESKRILKNNGILVVGVPGLKGFSLDNDHKKFYSPNDLDKLISSHGFTKINYFFSPFKSDFLDKNLSFYAYYGFFKKNPVR